MNDPWGHLPDDDYDWATSVGSLKPCPECGEAGACAYDAEGRPLIHVYTTREDDQ